jgi:hypothetical protein
VSFSGPRQYFAWPGLIDSSVHAVPSLADADGASARLLNLLYLLHGVTSVRHTWVGDESAVAAAGREVALGGAPGPRHFFAGAPVGGAALLGGGGGGEGAGAAVRAAAAGGACCVQVDGGASLEVLTAAADAAAGAGVALVGHPVRTQPLGLCRLSDALHLGGIPPVPASTFGSEARAFAAWVRAWGAVGDEELQKAAAVMKREGICATPCLARYWFGAGQPLPGLRGGVEAAHEALDEEGGSNGVGAPSAQAVMEAAAAREGAGHGAPEAAPEAAPAGGGGAAAPRRAPPPAVSVLSGVPAPRSAALARYASAWLPPVVPSVLWGTGALNSALAPAFAAPLPPAAAEAMPGAFPKMLAAVKALAAAGVPVHAGSDALAPGCLPGGGLHVELSLLRGAGFSDEEALAAATALPGAFLAALRRFGGAGAGAAGGLSGGVGGGWLPPPSPPRAAEPAFAASRLAWLGFLCEGAPADFVVSAVDPRGDLAGALGSIQAVVAAGVLHRREDIEAALWEAREGPGRENLAAALTTLFTHTLPVAPLISDAMSFLGFGRK